MATSTASFPVILLAIATLLLAISYTGQLLLMVTRTKKPPALRLPPSPWCLPIIGNLHQLRGLPHRTLRDLSAAHGSVMLLHLGRVPTLIVSSPDAAREVMQEQDHAFASRPSLTIPKRLLYGCTNISFAPHGEYWRNVRKIAMLHLLSPMRVRSHSHRTIREEEVAELVRRVEEAAAARGGVVQLSELLSSFTKDVAGRTVLGVRVSGGSGWRGKVDSLLHEADTLISTFHVGDYFPWLAWVAALDGTDAKVRRAFERFDGILEEILVAASDELTRAGTGERHDAFVHALLARQNDGTTAVDLGLTRDNMKALIEDLFGAADATRIILEWVMAELLRDKKAMQKLQHELRRSTTINGDGRLITEQELPQMVYLRAVIKETMRLHPPGPLLVPHESMQHAKVHGYDVPRGTRVIVNVWAIGRDPLIWDHADEFRPERFIGNEVDFRGQHFQLIPFGAGRRMCLGIEFTMAVVELALVNLLVRFNWAMPEGAPEVVDMEEATGFVLRKKVPLHARITMPA